MKTMTPGCFTTADPGATCRQLHHASLLRLSLSIITASRKDFVSFVTLVTLCPRGKTALQTNDGVAAETIGKEPERRGGPGSAGIKGHAVAVKLKNQI